MKKNIELLIIIIMIFLLCGCDNSSEGKVYSGSEKEVESTKEDERNIETETVQYVYVQIYGAVNSPGVYKVSSELRVFEALELAGGVTAQGDAEAINLARPVMDEMQIYIPTYDEVAKSEEVSFWQDETDGLIDINTASKEELMELPGIGESKAEDIISYREENGGFGNISDIKNVNGIKDAAFEKIKDKIKV